jgi:serine/threonine protein kinase
MYTKLHKIGKGGFGQVYAVQNQSGDVFAYKTCTDQRYLQDTVQEVSVMNKLSGCKNIVQLVDSVPNQDGYDIVMELCEGTLLSLLEQNDMNGLEEVVVLDLLRDISEGLAFMRDKSISHCDLKPENILYKRVSDSKSGYRFLLSDFGNAFEGYYLSQYHRLQTNHYRCMKNLLFSCEVKNCDMPSLACVLYEAITGQYLIDCAEDDELGQIRTQIDVIGMKLFPTSTKYNRETVYNRLPEELKRYMKHESSIRGTISRPNSVLNQAFERFDYINRSELTDLIKRLLIPEELLQIVPLDNGYRTRLLPRVEQLKMVQLKVFQDELEVFQDELKVFQDELKVFQDELEVFQDELEVFQEELEDVQDELEGFQDKDFQDKVEVPLKIQGVKSKRCKRSIKINKRTAKLIKKQTILYSALLKCKK